MIASLLLRLEVLSVNQTLERRLPFNILMYFLIVLIQIRNHSTKGAQIPRCKRECHQSTAPTFLTLSFDPAQVALRGEQGFTKTEIVGFVTELLFDSP